MTKKELTEIRFHGRGGQGAWTASALLAQSALLEARHVQSFPEFGPERMGAPIRAYTRISENPIRLHSGVYEPDVVVVLDPTLTKGGGVLEGIGQSGVLIVNTDQKPASLREALSVKGAEVWTVPATEIALRILGKAITNTAILGAVVKATDLVSLESLRRSILDRFSGETGEKNVQAAKAAYDQVVSA